MNDLIVKYKGKLIQFWQQLLTKQKILFVFSMAFIIIALIIVTAIFAKPNYVPTFVNLNEKTAWNVIEKLEEMEVPYITSGGGTIISVPEAEADRAKINVAQELDSGSIYNKFWDSATYGVTDSELSILERDALEQGLKALIVDGINGINKADVMLTLPKEKVFYSSKEQNATASVILNVEPGINLTSVQIKNIYYLISRSVPNLPIENIALSNQYSEPLEYNENGNSTTVSVYDEQRNIEINFQQSLRKDIETMLANIYGRDDISVNVFAKMNFDQKRTVESLKLPVIGDKGIPISTETVQESSSNADNSGGIEGTGETQIPTYQVDSGNESSYEYSKETVNYDVNEITNEIVGSPYNLEDLSITIAINRDPEAEQTQKVIEDITNLISPVLSAALKTDDNVIIDTSSKIAVIAQEFNQPISYFDDGSNKLSNLLLYGLAGLLVLIVGLVVFLLVKRKNKSKDLELMGLKGVEDIKPGFDFSPAFTEETALKQEIQKLTKRKPDEFTKLIRSWLYEE